LSVELTYLQFRREVGKRKEVEMRLDEMFSRIADQDEMILKVVRLSEQVSEPLDSSAIIVLTSPRFVLASICEERGLPRVLSCSLATVKRKLVRR